VPNALFFFNDIEKYDSFELRRALRNHSIDTVVLASEGGSVWEGLNMAGIIHDQGIATYVPKLPDKMGCYSACAYMFFGGKFRRADGILAVHQTGAYGSEHDKAQEKVSDTQQATQFTVSEIIGFLNEFETPPFVFEKMFRSRDLYEFNENEKDLLKRQTDEINLKNFRLINAFIESFLKYLSETVDEKGILDENEVREISREDEIRLVVIEVQKLLNKAGCDAGAADGIWGRKTQSAAVLYAKTARLPFENDDLISEQFIKSLKNATPNSCPKGRLSAQYSFKCGSQDAAQMRVNTASGNNFGSFTLSLGKDLKLYGKIFSLRNKSAKMRIGVKTHNLQLARSSTGLIKTFSFTTGSLRCIGRSK
jgi:hypothetical protein